MPDFVDDRIDVSEVVVVTMEDGSQILVRRWLTDDRIEVDWRAAASLLWTPIELRGGEFKVETQ